MTAEVLPADYPWAEKATGWGGYVMPWDFYGTFEEGDLRLKNVVTAYTNKNGEKIELMTALQKDGFIEGFTGSCLSVIQFRQSGTLAYTKDTTVSGFRRVSLMSPKGLSSKMIMIDSK